jgi:pyruvate formate lyase activating enzyme
MGPEAIMDDCNDKTSCICYFGGDPTPQLVYAIHASKRARERRKGILRVCWETNGSMNPHLLMRIAELSFESGGCVKVDLKAWDDKVHYALCGVSNRRTLSNFKLLAEYKNERRSTNPPLLIASTLLVPGYIDEYEVGNIARFIASLDRDIPYSLLGFHPHFQMEDLPRTSRKHAGRCLKAARNAGLRNVRVGNIHLLGNDY